MPKLDEYVIAAQKESSESFRRRHSQPFLLRRIAKLEEESEWSFKTQTISGAGLDPDTLARARSAAAGFLDYEILEVAKGSANPWKERISLGRAGNNDIVLPDNSISKLHAHFAKNADGQWTISDAGSRNGTKINGRSVEGGSTHIVRSGDEVTFGRVGMMFLEAAQLYDFIRERLARHEEAR